MKRLGKPFHLLGNKLRKFAEVEPRLRVVRITKRLQNGAYKNDEEKE